ncbi:MAG TPA: DUF1972 domain-containing protein [Accumulibacter sp.]|uniref:DUF1972 domain-containing protein n=1 Tax=Accumulibacter sp. TaxID=2053492 RepID=UPI002C0B4778|nr:DUF1972 domain-containing protein [Accumulibacter sp.]HMW54787.1 DUF1972 domain-containing protein [Accumulibacter sp.]HNG77953.1 DUF1972 domain-containing protein [Burkholderiaceae bacterium]
MPSRKKISIIGTVGLPANYGGFETLAENLVIHHQLAKSPHDITVYCSGKSYADRPDYFLSARLRYIPLKANGIQSVLYDIASLLHAIWNKADAIIILGVSGAVVLPLARLLSNTRIITNIDGIEWRREKWRGLAKRFLKISERIAVRYSDEVIADNEAIADYVRKTYDSNPHVIAYGGDHAVHVEAAALPTGVPVDGYALAICRIEPENNAAMILQAFSSLPSRTLVFIGNWNNSTYGQQLRQRYAGEAHLLLLDPIYDLGILKSLRTHASLYIHGHSAGGTNPSLVEAMHFGIPVLAYDCNFNRKTTEEQAIYFKDAKELALAISAPNCDAFIETGLKMKAIAQQRYTWPVVASQYFALMESIDNK